MVNYFSIVPFDASLHKRKNFTSGSFFLDKYFKEQLSQDIKRCVAACFVAIDADYNVCGYYMLSTASIPLINLPDNIKRKLPRYESIPAIRMGRLAVDKNYQGKGLGRSLLVDALKRAKDIEIPSAIFLVDAKDEKASKFYEKFGFISLVDKHLSLFYPLVSIKVSV